MPRLTFRNPPGVHSTGGRYSHSAIVEGAERWAHFSGQVGTRPDGTVAETGEEQCAVAVANLRALLADAGMTPANIVKLTVFLTDPALIPAYRAARAAAFGEGFAPASTLLIVAGLASPNDKVEIEAIACA
jgi:enamine deaminase RidA (YjgF/YER057c/UK114 family)